MTVSLTIAAVNDAPVAVAAEVTGMEDTPYVFAWSDFRVSDVDSVDLGITINTLPADGLLQFYDGIQWTAVLAGQRLTKVDIDAGLLCFGPDVNESGFAGYGLAGTGNNMQNYASFTYHADDGFLSSAVASMTVNIVPVADAPALALAAPVDAYGATATLFSTSWESAANRSPTFTILPQSTLEGWSVVKEVTHDDHHHDDHGQDAFVLWSSGDKMQHAKQDKTSDQRKDCEHDDGRKGYSVVQAAAGSNPLSNSLPQAGERTNEKDNRQFSGKNWLELGDAQGMGHQTYGIERTVETRAGAAYTLSLDYAGRLGYSAEFTRIGIYVDGVQIATHAGTSSNEALNWETLSFSFTGNGTAQTIRIVTEAPLPNPLPQAGEGANEKGAIRPSAMIDNIVLTEVTAINTGYQDGPIRLSAVIAALTDTDGSEVIGVTIGAIPTGATLTDGVNSFTASDSMHIVAVTYWDLANLSVTAPTGYSGSFALTVAASAIETATGEISNSAVTLPVTVMPANVADSTVGGTTGHLTDPAQDAGHAIGYSSLVTELKGADLHTTALGDSIGSFDVLSHGRAINHGWDSAQDGLRNAAVIDWSAKAISGSEADDNKKKLKGKQPASWLAGFLGIDKPAASLAESTGLNVTMPAVEEPKKPFEERSQRVSGDLDGSK